MSEQLVTAQTWDGGSLTAPRPVAMPRRRGRRSPNAWLLITGATDALVLAIAISLTDFAATGAWEAVTLLSSLAALLATGCYASRLRLPLERELLRVATATAVATLLGAALAMLVTGREGIGDAGVVHWLIAFGLVGAGRVGVLGAQRTAHKLRPTRGRVLIVGAGRVGHLTAKRLLEQRHLGLTPVGFLDKEPLIEDDAVLLGDMPPLPVLGASWDLERVVEERGIDHVIVAFSTAPHSVMLDLVRRCWALSVDVLVVPRLYEVDGQRMHVEHLGALPLVTVRTSDPRGWQVGMKYALDRVVAGAALLAISPLMVALWLAVRLTMGRPVLFRQPRVGRDGHVFDMLKFRTMRGTPQQGGEADAVWAARVISGDASNDYYPPLSEAAASGDDRRTPLGSVLRKLSLDELPQLWNVFRGDMSLIGPRPERAHYVERFEDAVYRYPDRHRMKSGVTGWAQVHGLRGETSLSDRIEWDNFYIEHWTPWLDIKIIAMTLPALLGRRRGH